MNESDPSLANNTGHFNLLITGFLFMAGFFFHRSSDSELKNVFVIFSG
jgi:hypothetical protein